MTVVTTIYEVMHWMHHQLLPQFLAEDVFNSGESGFVAEERLLGGVVLCEFPIAHLHDMARIHRITLRNSKQELYELCKSL